MANWVFEHSIYTIATRKDAWRYWTNMENHLEPGVERIELDGPFVVGTTGRTIARDYTQEWELSEVAEEKRLTILGYTPNKEGTLSFTWEFKDERNGTRMTQYIKASGPQVEQYMDVFHKMEENAPRLMNQLANELNRLAREGWN